MLVEHFLTTSDEDLWRKHLPVSRSVFGSLGYVRICEAFRNCSARLYVLQTDDTTLCYPLVLRSLGELPFRVETGAKWDATTPDFTGPLIFGNHAEAATAFPERRYAMVLR